VVMRGRELDGWLRIEAEALEQVQALQHWVKLGISYAGSLPPK
jgi:hypothetical protein